MERSGGWRAIFRPIDRQVARSMAQSDLEQPHALQDFLGDAMSPDVSLEPFELVLLATELILVFHVLAAFLLAALLAVFLLVSHDYAPWFGWWWWPFTTSAGFEEDSQQK